MDSIYDIIKPPIPVERVGNDATDFPSNSDSHTISYLSRLSTLSLNDLTNNETASLSQSSQSHLRNLQALSKRSHNVVISSSEELNHLEHILPSFSTQSNELQKHLPDLESEAARFAEKYERSSDNAVLDRRKRAMLLSRNADRVWDVLDLPSLLASSVAAAQTASSTSASSAASSYSAALDLSAHVKRLATLYPHSKVVAEVLKQTEAEVQNLTSILITSLTSPNLKLAAGMRTTGWLRRVAVELSEDMNGGSDVVSARQPSDGGLGALFLVCRLQTMHHTLDALEPLRDLADEEGQQSSKRTKATSSALGSQSERYLKRYIEVFREQSFNTISMYKSIFPTGLPQAKVDGEAADEDALALPSPIVSFALHLVEMLSGVLKQYMPNIIDRSARESLLTQVLYCAGSLGRLGADYGMLIALLEDGIPAGPGSVAQEPEWVAVMKKHRVQAGRLEILARGVGTRKVSGEVPLSTAMTA